MPWVKGQSGNPLGRLKSEKPFVDALHIAVAEAGADDKPKLRLIAQALVNKALEGDVAAIKEVADRLDGKVPQRIASADDENVPMILVVRWGEPKQLDKDNELPMLELRANATETKDR